VRLQAQSGSDGTSAISRALLTQLLLMRACSAGSGKIVVKKSQFKFLKKH
jgi:hypothetical protein